MTSFEHTNTFLRSALVKDPFCLGDLGPEDVLRIESEFPNLFCSSPQRIPERRIPRPASGSPYAVPLMPKTSASRLASPRNSNNLHTTRNVQGGCSRGTRCCPRPGSFGVVDGNLADPSKPMKPPIRHPVLKPHAKFSAFGGSVQKHVSRLQNNSSTDESDRLLNKYIAELATSRHKLQEANQALREKQSQVSKRLSEHKIGDSKYTATSIPARGARLLEITSIKRPPVKHAFPEQVHKLKPQTQSMPRFSTEQRSRDNVNKVYTKDHPQTKQVKFEQTKPHADILKQHAKKLLAKVKTAAPGFIRPTFSTPGIVKQNPKARTTRQPATQSHHTDEKNIDKPYVEAAASTDKLRVNDSMPATPRTHYMRGIDEETEPTLTASSISEADTSIASETPLWFSPVQIRNRMTSEEMRTEMTGRERLEVESTAKFEQLLFARLLASKYEQEGKFQKSEKLSEQTPRKHTPRAPQETKHQLQHLTEKVKYRMSSRPTVPSQVSLEHKSILEKIAEELVRAEVLKCIHTEELNAKIDIGVGTGSEPAECDNVDVNSKDNSLRLSTISEEHIIPTPELTPPPAALPKVTSVKANLQERIGNLDDDTLPTPEFSPPPKRASLKPSTKDNRAAQENINDLTDCSSISDFVFSDVVSIPTPNKIAKKLNRLAVLPDVQTPNVTPQPSDDEAAEDESKSSSVSAIIRTPPLSTSTSAVRFTLPNPILRERSTSAHSSKSRASGSSTKRTNSRSRLETLDSKSKPSTTDFLEEAESHSSIGSSAIRQVYTEMISDGEFLGIPYKSPGEVSWSVSLSPGRYLSNQDETESCYSHTFSEDLLGTEPSEGELRSRN